MNWAGGMKKKKRQRRIRSKKHEEYCWNPGSYCRKKWELQGDQQSVKHWELNRQIHIKVSKAPSSPCCVGRFNGPAVPDSSLLEPGRWGGSTRTRYKLCLVACWKLLFRAFLLSQDFQSVCAGCPLFLPYVKGREKDLPVTMQCGLIFTGMSGILP